MIRPASFILALLCVCASARLRAQCPDGTPPPCARASAARVPAPNSVAVLYFTNETRDTADQYLADGITEEIATTLGRIERLRVVSPSAVRRALAAANGDASRIAHALGVRHLVEGSVRRSGSQARITARLLGADARTAIWTDAYTRPTADLLALEEEIAGRVAGGVIGALMPEERRTLAASRSVDPAAHDHVMRGDFQLARRSEASIRRAIAEYEAACAVDSTYARAWSRLAFAQSLLRYWARISEHRAAEIDSILARGQRAASRALALDSTLADTWLALGYLRTYGDPIGMHGVLAAFRRAVALEPNNGEAHHALGTGYLWHGDTARARVDLMRALELDPGRLVSYANLSSLEILEGRGRAALIWADSALAIEPAHGFALVQRAVALAMLGDTTGALAAADAAERVGGSPVHRFPRCTVMTALRLVGARAECVRALGAAPLPYDSVTVYANLGDVDGALAALEAARASNAPFLWVLLPQPLMRPIASDPRFQRLRASLRPADAEGP